MKTRETLIAQAAQLPMAKGEAVEEFDGAVDTMSEALDEVMLGRPDLERLVGEGNVQMMQNNHRNHFRFMASVLRMPDAESLVETVLWVFRTYRAHGFHVSYWAAMLDTVLEIMRRKLSSGAYAAAVPYYEWLVINIPEFTLLSEAEETRWEQVPSHGHGEVE